MLAILAAAATLLMRASPVHAQNYPWCAYVMEGSMNCGFVSYEQCRATSGWCERNFMYRPPAETPRPGGKPRTRRP
jgi:hypothetical protein